MDLNLLDLNDVLRKIGRGVVFYAPTRWNPQLGDPLALTHLGDTEGDITVNLATETKGLTTPELTGPAMHEVDIMGENPTVEIPLYLADPDLWAIISPNGSANGGTSRRVSVQERTLVVFPEALYLKATGGVNEAKELSYAGGNWTLDGVALDAAQLLMLDQSMWFWRGFFTRTPRRLRGGGGDDGKNIDTATFQVMVHPDMPEGHQLWTTGDPWASSIDLDGGS